MPTQTVPEGDWLELGTFSFGDVLRVEPTGATIYATKDRDTAGMGQQIEAGRSDQLIVTKRKETVYVRSESGEATVTWRVEGFLSLITSLFNLDEERRVRQDQARQSSEGVTEVNADQTTSIPIEESQTTTITARTSQVWILKGFYFEWTADADWDGSTGDAVSITVETEAEGIELGHVTLTQIQSGNQFYYRSGQWQGDSGGGTANVRNDVLRGHKIDDTNGLNVVVDNSSPSHAVDNSRLIRGEFEVVKA